MHRLLGMFAVALSLAACGEIAGIGCTMIGCVSGFEVQFQRAGAWPAGTYRVTDTIRVRSHTVLRGRVFLRVNIENRLMERADILRLVGVLTRTTARMLAE